MPLQAASPIVLAQGAPVEMPPRARPGPDQSDSDETAPQRRGPPGRERGPAARGEEPSRPAHPPGPPGARPGPSGERPAPPAIAPEPQPPRAAPPQERQQSPERPQTRPEERPSGKQEPRAQERPRERSPERAPDQRPQERPQAAPDRGPPSPSTSPTEAPNRQPPAERLAPPGSRAAPPSDTNRQIAPRSAPSAAPTGETAPAQKSAPTPTAPTPQAPQRSLAPAQQPSAQPPAPPPSAAPAPTAAPTQPPAPTLQGIRPPPPPGAPTEARQAGERDVQSFEAFEKGRIDDLRRQRRERTEEGGRRIIIEEPGDRTIIREGDRVIIRHDETDRFRRTYSDADVRQERRGSENVTIVRRPDGTEIVTVVDQDGHLVRRIRREPAGREVVLIDNRRDRRRDGYFVEDVVRLPPPVVRIPREEYIVDVEDASEDQLVEAFTAPPVERIERAYTLDEVRQSAPLRERMRRVDLDTVTFDTGSWALPEVQIGAMTGIAEAIRRALDRNPNEIFLVEGHTDAVGSDEDNLTLSDRRAETVATLLTRRFGIPAENLTTQGYGEQYLKVDTQGAERQNRRVTIRRITPLLQGQNQAPQ
ncbi:flagellar motor protein MotB [Microvirga sp. 17 mud 1-3]|nr:flagellar motor protein MotB [Microvirga sp. 17 mud 1-3]